jgi:hypothetical protein
LCFYEAKRRRIAGKDYSDRVLTVIIKLPSRSDWFKANWLFRLFAHDVVAAAPEDCALKFVMEQAQALGTLHVNFMDKNEATKVMSAMRRVAQDTLSAKISGWKGTKPNDLDGQRMYLESVAELLDLLKKEMAEAK